MSSKPTEVQRSWMSDNDDLVHALVMLQCVQKLLINYYQLRYV